MLTKLINLKEPEIAQDGMVFILEKNNQPLGITKDKNGDIIMEGVCAVFGQMNSNNRIYEKQEYLPHLTYLNEKIKRGQLFGELDHPQSFDVSLKNVSHVVEGLTFNESNNTVNIRLRLLDTPSGRIAKTIVEAGGTISSSSRAAGQVLDGGKVKLHKIFTYDLVSEGGFHQSTLSQVAENLQGNYSMLFESLDTIKNTAITNRLTDISESFDFGNMVKIYEINNTEFKTTENNKKPMTNNFVTKEEMEQYSQVVKERMEALRKNIAKNNDNLVVLTEQADNSQVTKQLIDFTNYLASEMEQVIEFSNYLATMMNKGIGYTEHVAEKVNNVIDYSNYLANVSEQNIRYSNYLGEKLNQNINYSDYLGNMTDKSIKFGNYIAEQLDKGIQYTEHVAERASEGLNYSNYLAKSLNEAINYAEYLGTRIQKGIAYTEYVAETMNQKTGANTALKSRKLLSDVAMLNENKQYQINENSAVDDLVSTVDGILTNIKSNSANAVLENKYPFLKLLSNNNKQRFYALDTNTKSAIVEALKGSIYFTEPDVINIMEAVLNDQTDNIPNYIKFMPVKYKEIYEQMNESELNWIAAQAHTVKINTPYQAKAFWDSRDLRGIQNRLDEAQYNEIQSLNENQGKEGYVSLEHVQQVQRGYSNAYLESLKRKSQY